jgi:hypothetical protein
MTNLEEGNEIMLMGIPLFHVYGMVAGMHFAWLPAPAWSWSPTRATWWMC